MSKICLIIGTRPELIKVAPIIHEFNKRNFQEFIVVNTSQHKDLLEPYWEIFKIKPDYTLNLMSPNQSLIELNAKGLLQLQSLIDNLNELPQIIVAQGDTTTVLAASTVAFYKKIKFAHLEAGLRSFDLQNPFPEEYNRKICSISTQIHLAPTIISKDNLVNEGINESLIHIVGNTVVDALDYIKTSEAFEINKLDNKELNKFIKNRKIIIITCHRRENQNENLLNIIKAIEFLANANKDFSFVWALHPNPNIKNVVESSNLVNIENIILTKPLNYWDLIKLMSQSSLIITDSGGIQEEAPSFGVPVLILRDVTERPEGVNMGVAFLVGSDYDKIINNFNAYKNQIFVNTKNPYGDGRSAIRVVDILLSELNN